MDFIRRHTFRDGDHCTIDEIYAFNTITPMELERMREEYALVERMRRAEASHRAAEGARRVRQERMAKEWEAEHGER